MAPLPSIIRGRFSRRRDSSHNNRASSVACAWACISRLCQESGLAEQMAPFCAIFSEARFSCHQLQMLNATNSAEPEMAPLLYPGKRHVGGAQQMAASQSCGLAPFGDRRRNVRCKPAHPKKLPDVTLAVARDD